MQEKPRQRQKSSKVLSRLIGQSLKKLETFFIGLYGKQNANAGKVSSCCKSLFVFVISFTFVLFYVCVSVPMHTI